ncbi:MAG: hypothetical protein HGA19_22725, partial [Oscillochloris sp.]|nr:hypothetical protein [Oscillochloris sp.]
GLILLGRRRPRILVAWLGFALPSLLLHLSRPTHFMQNMLPLLVACALPVGVTVAEVGRLALRRSPAFGAGVVAVLLSALLLPATYTSLIYVGRQAGGDTRVKLIDWIAQNVPPGTRIAAELKPVPGKIEQRWTDVPIMATHDMAWYRAQGYAYLVLSSKRWNQLEPPESYDKLLSAGVVKEFGSQRREDMLGSRLLVINTGLSPADIPQPIADDLRFGGTRLLGITIGDPSADGAPPMLVQGGTLKPGGVLGLRTFWQVEQPFTDDFFIFVHLIDANGGVPTQRDAPPWQGRFPTSSWQAGTMVVDANDVYLPPELAPGEYRVVIGMFSPENNARPPVTINGTPVPNGEYEIARITVAP